MKRATAPRLQDRGATIAYIASALDNCHRYAINQAFLDTGLYKPVVQFSIAYGAAAIYLKYYVQEENLRAVNNTIHAPVYEDSCVEFFVSFENSGYYNLEFNCLGTCLAAFGNGKDNRTLLAESAVQQIQTQTLLQHNEKGYAWELTLLLPFTLFTHHHITNLQGTACSVNFYKCGDSLPKPHFLCWNAVDAPAPDFHVPNSFGQLLFD